MTFGEHFRKARQKLGMSESDLAQLIGCTQVMIHKIETGKNNPSWETLLKILSIKQFKAAFDDFQIENVKLKRIKLVLE